MATCIEIFLVYNQDMARKRIYPVVPKSKNPDLARHAESRQLASQLADRIGEYNITQCELADAAGMESSSIGRFLAGRSLSMNMTNFVQLVKALGGKVEVKFGRVPRSRYHR
jgi:hypothetical protein